MCRSSSRSRRPDRHQCSCALAGSPEAEQPRRRRWRPFLEQVRGRQARCGATLGLGERPDGAGELALEHDLDRLAVELAHALEPDRRLADFDGEAVERAGRGRVTAALFARTREWDRSGRRDLARLLATSHLRPAAAFGRGARGDTGPGSDTGRRIVGLEPRIELARERLGGRDTRSVTDGVALERDPDVAGASGRVLERDQPVVAAEAPAADQQPARLAGLRVDPDVLELADVGAVDVVDAVADPPEGLLEAPGRAMLRSSSITVTQVSVLIQPSARLP